MVTVSEETLTQIREVARAEGCRLLALESSGAGKFSVLRAVLERAEGAPVGLEECEAVSRRISAILDASDEIPHRYTLEVSSPGLDRRLYSLEDAARFVGRRVRVRMEDPVTAADTADGAPSGLPSRNLRGLLAKVDGDVLTIVDEENRKTYNVRFAEIRQARLDFEWPDRGRAISR